MYIATSSVKGCCDDRLIPPSIHRWRSAGAAGRPACAHLWDLFTSQAEARMAVFSYIEGWYNPARRHSGIRYLSPIAYEITDLKETQTT